MVHDKKKRDRLVIYILRYRLNETVASSQPSMLNSLSIATASDEPHYGTTMLFSSCWRCSVMLAGLIELRANV
jgi:hypothetical protein